MADPLLGFTLAQQGINLAPGALEYTGGGSGTFGLPQSSGSSGSSGSSPPPTPKFVYQLKEKLLRPALTSHFQCWFQPPQPVVGWLSQRGFNYSFNQELISLSCSEASLPGSSLMTNEIADDRTGVTERFAYRRQYDDRADFTFYVDHGRGDGNYNIIWFFENWISYISNEQYAFGLEDNNFNYRVNYPDDYQSNAIYINKFERDFVGQSLEYKFLRAYPISINSMPVSYDSSQLLKCTVSFTYTRYLVKRGNVDVPKQEPPRQTANETPKAPPPAVTPTPFDTSKMTRTITNEYYNNGIIRGSSPSQQRQGPGQRSQDATNSLNFLGRDLA